MMVLALAYASLPLKASAKLLTWDVIHSPHPSAPVTLSPPKWFPPHAPVQRRPSHSGSTKYLSLQVACPAYAQFWHSGHFSQVAIISKIPTYPLFSKQSYHFCFLEINNRTQHNTIQYAPGSLQHQEYLSVYTIIYIVIIIVNIDHLSSIYGYL